MPEHLTIWRDEYPSGVVTHRDILTHRPSVLSRERAKKVGAWQQKPMVDSRSPDNPCRLCHTEHLVGRPTITELCEGRVGAFENAAPYLPSDQNVLFVMHADAAITEDTLHIWQLQQIRKFELYYILKGAVELGKIFAQKALTSTDLPRMIVGFNIGEKAGQSLQHIHGQYGWEVVLDKTNISPLALQLFYEELGQEDLILHSNSQFKLIAPWTPRGQYAIDLFFPQTYEIHRLSEQEMFIFAWIGNRILQKYYEANIHNVNIVFESSPLARQIVPVIVHFIPRTNMPALYEYIGRDVVDTPPSSIYNFFRPMIGDWLAEEEAIQLYSPEKEYEEAIANR